MFRVLSAVVPGKTLKDFLRDVKPRPAARGAGADVVTG